MNREAKQRKHSHDFFLNEHGILFKLAENPREYDPPKLLVIPRTLRREVLTQCHDDPLSSHLGYDRTIRKIKLRYFWPLMASDIKDWISTCEPCAKRKRNYGFKKAPLN